MKQQEIIDKWLQGVKADLIKEYNSLGLRASGNWEKSLETFSTDNRAIIYGAKYTYQMENGRKPGKYPPRQAIEDWIDAKGLRYTIKKSSLAFLIQRKIAQEGIKVPNKYNRGGVVSSVVTMDRINSLISELQLVNVLQVSSDIIDIIKEK